MNFGLALSCWQLCKNNSFNFDLWIEALKFTLLHAAFDQGGVLNNIFDLLSVPLALVKEHQESLNFSAYCPEI